MIAECVFTNPIQRSVCPTNGTNIWRKNTFAFIRSVAIRFKMKEIKKKRNNLSLALNRWKLEYSLTKTKQRNKIKIVAQIAIGHIVVYIQTKVIARTIPNKPTFFHRDKPTVCVWIYSMNRKLRPCVNHVFLSFELILLFFRRARTSDRFFASYWNPYWTDDMSIFTCGQCISFQHVFAFIYRIVYMQWFNVLTIFREKASDRSEFWACEKQSERKK